MPLVTEKPEKYEETVGLRAFVSNQLNIAKTCSYVLL